MESHREIGSEEVVVGGIVLSNASTDAPQRIITDQVCYAAVQVVLWLGGKATYPKVAYGTTVSLSETCHSPTHLGWALSYQKNRFVSPWPAYVLVWLNSM
ncbi:MAG: hypothetical protein H6822_31800 [Planctomycetaceae bacterium]|nr:hypothetical protein [Planctomycetales bacterium]MCB9926767.1 hypothetical protein [Planctomycetaceae bacterium]